MAKDVKLSIHYLLSSIYHLPSSHFCPSLTLTVKSEA